MAISLSRHAETNEVSTPAIRILGEFAASLREADLPRPVIETAKCHLLYNLTCGLAAQDAARPVWELVEGSQPAEATLIARGGRVPAELAAFANGVLLHGRAQDDTHLASQTHPGTVVIPAALAVAESTSAGPKGFLAGMVAGYEVTAALGEPLADDAIERGFRATMLFGTLGAAAAAGSVLGLDGERIGDAIALATSFTGGLNQTWLDGSSEWMYHAGVAARNGVVAARLALAGERGAARALEGRAGFARAFAGRETWVPPRNWELGTRWRIAEVIYKPYPVCNITQNPVAVTSRLAERSNLSPGEVRSARLYLNPADRVFPGTSNWGPFDGVGATLMSAPYCVAMALKHRKASLAALREWDDPVLQDLVRRVEVLPDDGLPELGARVEVETVDGRLLADEITSDADETFSGSWDEVVAATRSLAPEMPCGGRGLDRLRRTIERVEEIASVRELADATIA
jgi:2-methylcitrate dehydratase PrpD